MPLYVSLASLSQTAASNAADGSVDAPSTIDQQTNLLASFIAQLRDGNGFTTGAGNVGQCRLTKSGANLLLSPYQGNGLTINGVVCKIPGAGITLAPGALSAGTLYYIYATASGTAVSTLEASTTAHATDATTGVEIKSGDATRTLVGMARPIAGPAFADTDAQRFVCSWFNRRPRRIYLNAGSNVVNGNTTPVQLLGNMEYLAWGDAVQASFVGSVSNNTANAVCWTALSSDSTSAFAHSVSSYQAYATSSNGSCTGGSTFTLGEGYHFNSLLGNVSGGVGTWASGLEMSGVVQG